MKILFIAPTSIHSDRWIGYFADQDYEVHVLNMDNELDNKLAKVRYHFVETKKNNILRFFAIRSALKRIVGQVKPEIVHIHSVGLFAYLVSRLGIHPTIITPWGSDVLINPKKSFIRKYIVKKALNGAEAITCDAQHVVNEIVGFGISRSKIELIYFGTDVNKFNPDRKDKNLSAELGFPNDSQLVLSLRSLEPIYDVETLIRAIPLVLRKNSRVGFVVVGKGSEKQRLIQLVKDLGVSEYVKFTGPLSDEDMVRYAASAAVYISTSLSDAGLAASTAEAMASGVPVVITDFGNNNQWVEHGVSGFLFKLRNYEGLAEHIIRLLEDKRLAAELGQAGMQVIRERNNWYREMQKVDSLYKKLILSY